MSLPIVSGTFRIALDPEIRFAPSGTAVASLRLVADSRKQQNGEWVPDKEVWITATVFGKMAENLIQSVEKGDLVVVTGRLVTESWERDGQRRQDTRLLVDEIGPSARFREMPHSGGHTAASGASSTTQAQHPRATPSQAQEPTQGFSQSGETAPPF